MVIDNEEPVRKNKQSVFCAGDVPESVRYREHWSFQIAGDRNRLKNQDYLSCLVNALR
jgi:hypothetical protein